MKSEIREWFACFVKIILRLESHKLRYIYYMVLNKTLPCDWLSKREGWRYLVQSGLPAVSRKKNFP